MLLRRETHRDFLGWAKSQRRETYRESARDQGRRRFRLDHRTQLVSTATCRSDQVARLDHGHLRRLGLCSLTTRLARGRLSRRISSVRGLAILGKRLPVIWEDPYK